MVLEINLHNFVRKPEHYRVPGSHPLLHIDNIHDSSGLLLHILWDLLIGFRLLSPFQIASEMLQEGDFLLKVFGVVSESVLKAYILAISTAALHVIKVETVWIKDDFCRVIEEHSCRFVAKEVSNTVFGRIVNPFLDPDLILTGLLEARSAFSLCSARLRFRIGSGVPVCCQFVHFAATSKVIGSYWGCLSLA